MPPLVSVVIASRNSGGLLKDCLSSLERQSVKDGFEVIVVNSSNDGSRQLVREQFPEVKLVSIPYPGSRAMMRAIGVSYAEGEIVAVTEDHCVPREDWMARIIENHRAPVVAVGGAVENSAEDRADYWAIYFCEYYKFMHPVPAGPVTCIPGSNAAYKRSALARTDFGETGLWETLISTQLGDNGHVEGIVSDPTQVICHNKREKPLSFLIHRYYYSRCFAGLRTRQISAPRRLFYLAFSPTLPILILWRTFRDTWRKGRHRIKLLRALPFLVPFLISSALGEFTGYALGVGDSWRKMD